MVEYLNEPGGLGEMGYHQIYQAMFVVNDGTISDVKGAFFQITGFSKVDFLHKSIRSVFKNLLKATIDINHVKPGIHPVTCFIFTKASEAREVNLSAKAGPDSEGIFYRIEESPGIRLNKRFGSLKYLFYDKKLGACILSVPDRFILRANMALLKLLGCGTLKSHREALGLRLDDLIAQELLGDIKSDLSRVIQQKESHSSVRLTSLTGKQYCSINLIPIVEHQKIKYIVGIFKDVTSFMLEMEKSLERKKQLEIIIENMSDGLIITDNKANVLMMNATARAYYKNPDEMNALTACFEKVKVTDMDGNPVPAEAMPAHRALKGEKVKNFRVSITGWNGKRIFEYNSSPLYDQNGNIIMTISCSRDVTEQVEHEKMVKAQQEELQKKNEALRRAMALKDEFLSLISHEFKTPISVIIAAVQTMEAFYGAQLDERAKSYIRRIRQNAYRQLRLVNHLLELARISSGQIKLHIRNYDIVFLSSSITRSVIPYADQKGVNLCFSSTIKRKIIGIDEEKHERILLNLLSNAIKFTPRDKSIFVRISYIKSRQGGQVCVEVEDEGVGIPEDKQKQIFDKFVQIDEAQMSGAGGTGLGLSLAKFYAEALGGSLSLKSQAGKGSCFTLLLPDRRADNADSAAEAAAGDLSLGLVEVEFSDLYPME